MRKNYQSILTIGGALTLLLAISVAPVQADQNTFPSRNVWMYDSITAEKIHKNLARGDVAVGLSQFEQKTLEKYGISVGQSFITQVNDKKLRVTRTSTGLRFEGSVASLAVGNLQSFPIQTRYGVVLASYPKRDRDDVRTNLTWVFDNAMQEKIQRHIFSAGDSNVIGLTRYQQKLLQRYGIEVGHSFQTSVGGMILTVKRVGLGLQIQPPKDKPDSYFSS